jgi:hypothetical protein
VEQIVVALSDEIAFNTIAEEVLKDTERINRHCATRENELAHRVPAVEEDLRLCGKNDRKAICGACN